jgi:ATP-binding cassette subfamily B protein
VVGIAVLPQLYAQLKLSHQRVGLAVGNSPRERRASYYGHVLSGVQFAKEVRLFNLAEFFLQAFRRTFQEISQVQRQQQARELRWQVALAGLTSLVASGAFVLVMFRAFAGELSLGDVTLYTSAVASIQGALTSIILALSTLNEGILFFRRYTELLALPQPLSLASSPPPVPRLTSSIELRNVSFRYSEQHPWILRDVSLFIPAGQCMALVGLNGSGKTTLVKLITRLYDPSEGQILWDGIDIRAFAPQDLRRHCSTIFQDFTRYDLTAHENVGLGDVTRLEESAYVCQAAIQAGIHDTITSLPNGYQTTLSRWLAGNGPGVDLSGGEWQKIALARMLTRQVDLMILDEPSASLDAEAEYDLYHHFVELVGGQTSLLISHRFSTVRLADQIAVLDEGRITECGAHDELLMRGGRYAALYRMQAEQFGVI